MPDKLDKQDKLDKILIRGMEFWGRHGVGTSERDLPWKLSVDLEVWADCREAGTTDDFTKAIDYVQLHHTARAVVEEGRQQLLEAIAEEIAERVLSDARIQGVRVRVGKAQVPIADFCGSVAVEINRGKGSWR